MAEQFSLLLYPAADAALNPEFCTTVGPFDSEPDAVKYGEAHKGDGLFQVYPMISPGIPGTIDFWPLALLIEERDEDDLYGKLVNGIDALVEEAVKSHSLHTADFEMTEKLQFLLEELPHDLAVFLREHQLEMPTA